MLHLESVSGLSQQALIIDVAAKVLADNLDSQMCQRDWKSRRCTLAAEGILVIFSNGIHQMPGHLRLPAFLGEGFAGPAFQARH